MTYTPKEPQLIQHQFVLEQRDKHVKAVLEKWEAKRQAIIAKEVKPHNPKKATRKELKEMASWGVKYTTE